MILSAIDKTEEYVPDIPPKAYAGEVEVVEIPPVKEEVVVIQNSKDDEVACNCYLYQKLRHPTLPRTADLKANTTPKVGAVAMFDYDILPNKPHDHYAEVTELEEKGFWVRDSNFGGCGFRTHFISWSDPSLVGFWSEVED